MKPRSKFSKQIAALQLAFLQALKTLQRPCSIDDATPQLRKKFDVQNAPWRGMALLQLQRDKLIERVEYVRSQRPSRHGTPTALWRLVDVVAADARLQLLCPTPRKKKKTA